MTLDVRSIIGQIRCRLLVFFVLLLVVRGLPSLLVYRHACRAGAAGGDDLYHRHDDAAAGRPGRNRRT